MNGAVLVLRPQPGAEQTAARARKLGLDPVVTPLFTVEALTWQAPDPGSYEAVMLTSANAARCAGAGLTPFLQLPAYAVGEATAAAAREAGFAEVRIGPGDGGALVARMAADGIRSAFHPCGEDRREIGHSALRLDSVPVYAAHPLARLQPEAEAALARGALALLHSPRAAARFRALVGERRASLSIAAISPAAADAAGAGWRAVAIAPRPRDEALLELAAKLCQTERDDQ